MVLLKALVVLSAVAAAAAAPTAHVVFVIGQSNSIGYNSAGHNEEDVAFPNILQTSCCDNGQAINDQCKFVQGQDPLHHFCDAGNLAAQTIGFGMSFARALRADLPQDDIIVLVPAGIGGTGFVDDVWTAYTGRGFVPALQRLQSTFRNLATAYPTHTPVFEAILWHQGETDAEVNTTSEQYLVNEIIPMINAWRDKNLIPQSGPTVPFVVGNMVPSWIFDPNNTKRLGVFAALQLLPQYVPYSAAAPSQGLLGDVSEGAGAIHFSAPSQRNFGKRYYAALKAAKTNYGV